VCFRSGGRSRSSVRSAHPPAWRRPGSLRADEAWIYFAGGFDSKLERVQQRAVATVNYALGPGINLDGEIAYTWRDRDPESLTKTDDDYDGVEFGIGTALAF
jgi:hypothetical protein